VAKPVQYTVVSGSTGKLLAAAGTAHLARRPPNFALEIVRG
jgi:hypothetical protein